MDLDKMIFLYPLLLLIIVFSNESLTQHHHATLGGIDFQPVNAYKGGHIRDLKVLDENKVVFAGQGFGIGILEAGVVTMKNPESLLPLEKHFESVAVSGSTIYAAGGADYLLDFPGFFKSTDEGETWEYLGGQGENFRDIAVNQNVYPITDNLVYQLVGNNLLDFSSGLTITDLRTIFHDDRDGTLQVGGENGLATYDFVASAWAANSLNVAIVDIIKGPGNKTYYLSPTKIFESTDKINYTELYERTDSGSFTAFTYCSPVQKIFVTSVYPTFDASNITVGSFDINSNTFANESEGLPPNAGIPNAIEADDSYLHLGTSTGYFKRTKAAGPWENPLQIFNGSNVTAVSYNNYNNYLHVGTDYGAASISVSLVDTFLNNDAGLFYQRIYDIVHTTDGGTMYIQSSHIMYQPGPFQPFEQRENGSTLSVYRTAAINPNNGFIVVGGLFGFNVTSDNGLSWNNLNFSDVVDKVEYSESANCFIAQAFNKILKISADGTSYTIIADNINNPPPEGIGIIDIPDSTKIGMWTQTSFWILDTLGNYERNLTLNGLQPGEYIDKAAWVEKLGTWMAISSGGGFSDNTKLVSESRVYLYNDPLSHWDLVRIFLAVLTDLETYDYNFSDGQEETIFIGVYGGGLLTDAFPNNVLDYKNTMVSDYELSQNYPNPFNPATTISFSIPEASFVSLKVFNSLGEEVETLFSKELSAGKYKYSWNAINLPSGIYFYKIQAGDFAETKKMILLK